MSAIHTAVPLSQHPIQLAFLIHTFRLANVSLHQNDTSNCYMLQFTCNFIVNVKCALQPNRAQCVVSKVRCSVVL